MAKKTSSKYKIQYY